MIKKLLALALMGVVLTACKISYTFSGASISDDVKTASVAYFNNQAPMVAPILSPTLTDELTQKIQQQARLEIVREDGDVMFSGEIIDYTSAPISISADEYAQQNRLTIKVKVKYENTKEPSLSYDKVFTAYEDYSTTQMLVAVENELIPAIVEKLVEEIFNDAFANW